MEGRGWDGIGWEERRGKRRGEWREGERGGECEKGGVRDQIQIIGS